MNQPKPADSADQQGQSQERQVQNASAAQVSRFVTTIKNAEQQVGEHVIRALQHQTTVAVVTSVVVGPGGQQHIVSAALSPQQAATVNQLLAGASQEREAQELCVGFHCLLDAKKGAAGLEQAPPAEPPQG